MGHISPDVFVLESPYDWQIWYSHMRVLALKYNELEHVDIDSPAELHGILSFTDNAKFKYQSQKNAYKWKLAEYNRQRESLAAVLLHIYTTVEISILQLYIHTADIKEDSEG
ncbi:hypothetical protein AJ80_07440 [Polytolypa hystricis UAMH7299]|uniref:Uncharacterized protein n=1 Tax=Polytolypa hystricis (strain UAMH7299) TaxID=1447883 RepID=A0A2B7XG31_POLH7|nr:hypothetical protein AJ80_07440 [Polytolypa hystricis UAMH7299]